MLLKLPQLFPTAKKTATRIQFFSMKQFWTDSSQNADARKLIEPFFSKVVIMASQFYCLPAEIFGVHFLILHAPEQTVPATQKINKMMNRFKWLIPYSYSDDNLLMRSS